MVHHFWMLLTGNYIRCLKTVDDKFRIKRKIVREFKDISFGNSLEKGYQLCLVFFVWRHFSRLMTAHSVHQEFSAGSSLPVSANFEPNSSEGKNFSWWGATGQARNLYSLPHKNALSQRSAKKFGICYLAAATTVRCAMCKFRSELNFIKAGKFMQKFYSISDMSTPTQVRVELLRAMFAKVVAIVELCADVADGVWCASLDCLKHDIYCNCLAGGYATFPAFPAFLPPP